MILRMLPVYNEADVLVRNLSWYANAGFPTVVVDNGSTDGSWEICETALASGQILALERIATDRHEWDRILVALLDLAGRQAPDYLIFTGADEFFEVADGSNLYDAIQEDFAAGYNLVKFFNMEFRLTVQDDPADPDVLRRMRWYSLYDQEMYRAYPHLPGLDLVPKLGHRPAFPAGVLDRPSPRRYVSRHYPLRSVEQANRKIRRIRPNPRLPGAHHHYLKYQSGDPCEYFVPIDRLFRYDEDHNWRYEQRDLPWRLEETASAFAHVSLKRSAEAQRLIDVEQRLSDVEQRLSDVEYQRVVLQRQIEVLRRRRAFRLAETLMPFGTLRRWLYDRLVERASVSSP